MMPSPLGEGVHNRLREIGTSCPIFAHDRGMWTFLTQRRIGADPIVDAMLLGLGARIESYGQEIVLPSPLTEKDGVRQWVSVPYDQFRPSMDTVVYVADYVSGRRCLAMRHGRGGDIRGTPFAWVPLSASRLVLAP
ncbi:hypothetical protein [Nocardia terpenica]|uniref:Uncharacterized protein n=1 Tax=Nocardia terpenica TaxID=455432 RepID=A0A6G9Z7G0_9NOCA|nr:hypothetical protein [Nocardia terpenica]QIS21384.1 hypothetical protein F6W96_26655 [Nocardia terpenica]